MATVIPTTLPTIGIVGIGVGDGILGTPHGMARVGMATHIGLGAGAGILGSHPVGATHGAITITDGMAGVAASLTISHRPAQCALTIRAT